MISGDCGFPDGVVHAHTEVCLQAGQRAQESRLPGEKDQTCPRGPHRGPEGPNEDIAQCPVCWMPTFSMRPENEQIGLHADDCSLPRRHEGYCVGGGDGHPPTAVVRGYWPGFDADVAAARARFDVNRLPGSRADQ